MENQKRLFVQSNFVRCSTLLHFVSYVHRMYDHGYFDRGDKPEYPQLDSFAVYEMVSTDS